MRAHRPSVRYLASTIKQSHTHQIFKAGNRLRDDRLRYREMLSGLDHAALFDNGEKDVQMAQLETAADLLGSTHIGSNSKKLWGQRIKELFNYKEKEHGATNI